MTERARRLVGGDDCQNRAARRYEKCSYLWHYFRRFEPSLLLFRPFPLPPRRRTCAFFANRSLVPLFPASSPPPRSSSLPPGRFRGARVVLTSSPRASSVPPGPPATSLLCPPSPSPPDRPTPRPVVGPTTGERAQRGDCPHRRRGHYFNVTLIKSNNQYLPRKKF